MIHIQSQYAAKKRAEILGIAEWVALAAAVPEADIQVTIRPEGKRAPIVVRKRLRNCEQHLLRTWVDSVRLPVGWKFKLRNNRPAWFVISARIADKETAVFRKVGVQREAKQALLVGFFAIAYDGAQVEDEASSRGIGGVFEAMDCPSLRGHKEVAERIATECDRPDVLDFPLRSLSIEILKFELAECGYAVNVNPSIDRIVDIGFVTEGTNFDVPERNPVAVVL